MDRDGKGVEENSTALVGWMKKERKVGRRGRRLAFYVRGSEVDWRKKKWLDRPWCRKKKLLSQARIENFSGATEGGEGGKWGVDCMLGEPRCSSDIHA